MAACCARLGSASDWLLLFTGAVNVGCLGGGGRWGGASAALRALRPGVDVGLVSDDCDAASLLAGKMRY